MDQINYRNNLQDFLDHLKNSVVEGVGFDIDNNPTFDKKVIPFEFKYCNSIYIKTAKESFDIITSNTESSLQTFWILPSTEEKNFSSFLEIHSKVKSTEFKNGYDNYAFKIKIEFEKSTLFLYAGEIYDTVNGDLDYKMNDEMILVFENEKDAEAYERMINYA